MCVFKKNDTECTHESADVYLHFSVNVTSQAFGRVLGCWEFALHMLHILVHILWFI